MEFKDKLQQLRADKKLTQEQLAQALFVSRTAISKWESGRGYPSIESLKQISLYFDISLDELLSNSELIEIAKKNNDNNILYNMKLCFCLTNLILILFFFFPLFGYEEKGEIIECSLLQLKAHTYITVPYYILIILSILNGIISLFTINNFSKKISNILLYISVFFLAIQTFFFMMSGQPYAGSLSLMIMLIQGVLLLKITMTR